MRSSPAKSRGSSAWSPGRCITFGALGIGAGIVTPAVVTFAWMALIALGGFVMEGPGRQVPGFLFVIPIIGVAAGAVLVTLGICGVMVGVLRLTQHK